MPRSGSAAGGDRSRCRSLTERIEPGHVFTAFHFPEVRTNLLIGPSADINTSCPEYKVVAVSVEPAGRTPLPRAVAEPALSGWRMAFLEGVAAGMLARVERDGGTDEVAVELPLEIRLNGEPVAVTMRTPGHDLELAAGFLYGEGIVESAPEVTLPDDLAANTVEVRAAVGAGQRLLRPPCGICAGALEEVDARPQGGGPRSRVPSWRVPERLRQPVFDRTGGLHATGLFTGVGGEPLLVREDVGATTRWTRSSAARCSTAAAAVRARAVRERPARFRARAEGRPGRLPGSGGRRRPRHWRSNWPTTAGSPWPGLPGGAPQERYTHPERIPLVAEGQSA